MSAAKPAMKFDQFDLSSITRAVERLDESGNEFTGKVATGTAVLTVKYDEDNGLHIVTAVEAK